jgi:hypothetical protein
MEDQDDDTDDTKGQRFDPQKFACPTMAYEYEEQFNAYVELRVMGTPRELALMEAFDMLRTGADLSNVRTVALAADMNPYVRVHFKKVLREKDIKRDMWSEKMAVNRLLELVNDDSVRDSTRLNAITALNVLCGYIQLDEATSRRVGHTLADFARLNADSVPLESDDGKPDARAVH